MGRCHPWSSWRAGVLYSRKASSYTHIEKKGFILHVPMLEQLVYSPFEGGVYVGRGGVYVVRGGVFM